MNAIVFSAHGWNTSWLGCYGNEWIATYSLDHLAAESVIFDQHFAEWPSIAGANSAWQTGEWGGPHRRGNRNLLDDLLATGVQGTLLRDTRPENALGLPGKWSRVIDTNGESDLLEAIEDGLSSFAQGDRQLLWIETDQLIPTWMVDEELFTEYAMPTEGEEPLEPWPDPPEGNLADDPVLWERLRNSYAAAVTLLDQQIGELHAAIADLANPTCLMVTSAWGYALAEHEYVGSRCPTPFEECVHIPLVVRFPQQAHAGRRVSALTSTIDLLPTLFDLFGQAPSESVSGRSMLPLCKGEGAWSRSHIPFRSPATGALAGVRTREWSYLNLHDQKGLFRKPDDRWEVDNVRRHHLEWSDYLDTHLAAVDLAVQTGEPLPTIREWSREDHSQPS